MVTFRWFGQACFEIDSSSTVVTDPHDGDSVGLHVPETKGDFVIISHDHYDHASGKSMVSGDGSTVIEGTDTSGSEQIDLERFVSYHDKVSGDARGENIISKFQVDGASICHLGDLGHLLDEDKIEEIKPVDVLLIPVGGKFTIDGLEAAELVRSLEPRIVIPMHYKVDGLKVPVSGPERFLKDIEKDYVVRRVEELSFDALPEDKSVYVLECMA